jgi:hypothetical protein
MLVSNSIVTSASDLKFTSITRYSAIKFVKQSEASISDSTFTNLGSTSLLNAAAIYVENSKLTLTHSTFENNTAINGACIDLS